MNEYDSNRIYDLVSKIGFNKTDIKNEADCFVLNTCHIREKATEKVYHEIGRVKKDFKNLKKPLVIVSGCVAQAESEDHLDVDELHKRVNKLDAKISIATVYRTVKLFEESGIIARHDFKGNKARYEQTTEEHHDHLIDVNTGEITEFVNEDIE